MVKLELISSANAALLKEWLDIKSALEGTSPNTLAAYNRDLMDFFSFLTIHTGIKSSVGQLEKVDQASMRAWMAENRRSGKSSRSIARQLSSVKSFYRWLGKRRGIDPTLVLITKAPKFQKKFPPRLLNSFLKVGKLVFIESESLIFKGPNFVPIIENAIAIRWSKSV